MAGGEHEFTGSDSFLDVITNFVGILIILVMVVGEKAKQFAEASTARVASQLAAARDEEASIAGDVRRLTAQMRTVDSELAARGAERNQINTMVAAGDRELAARRAALNDASRAKYDLERDMALARDELARLAAERAHVDQVAVPETIKIESYPTPIGKTVNGKEVHFQLSGGRLTFVPFDALMSKLIGEVRERNLHMQDDMAASDTIGPVAGFRMRYYIERVETPRGLMTSLSRVELFPVSSGLGERVDQALEPNSKFRAELQMISPRQYTVTIWTYPDSFAEFRRLKKELYQLGYAVAARPLPEGMPIGASPHGTKSSAE